MPQNGPDRIIDIPGVGVVSFPGYLSDEEVNTAVTKVYQGAQGGAGSRLLSGAWKNLNPVTALQGIYGAARHPIQTGGAILDAQLSELKKAVGDYQQGRYSEMVGHGTAGLLPLIGPAASTAGEHIAAGDVAGGIGEGLGLVAPFGAAEAARGVKAGTQAAVRGARAVPKGAAALDAVAQMADRASTSRMVDVMAPKVGPNKTRFGRQAAKIAPELAREPDLSAVSRAGLHSKVQSKLAEATAALDDAANARGGSAQVETAPLLKKVDEAIAALTAQPVEGSRIVPSVTSSAVREVPENPGRRYALQWIRDDMTNIPFVKKSFNEIPRGRGGDLDVVGGAAGAPIYRAIVGAEGREVYKATRSQVVKAIDDVLAGNTEGQLRQLVIGVADDLARGDARTQRLMATSGPMAESTSPPPQFQQLTRGKPAPPPTKAGRPMGQPVEPGPSGQEIDTLRRIRDEIAQLGPVAPYESVRRIRQAWDQTAKVKYLPSTAADALKSQGEARAAMKGTGAMRDALAESDPATATANARYRLFRSAQDILAATDEAEQVRPKVGRRIVARATGAMIGAQHGGTVGAGMGVVVASLAERAAELAPTGQIALARQFAKIADLLRAGKANEAQAVLQDAKTFVQRAKRAPMRFGNPLQHSTQALPTAAGDRRDQPGATSRR